MRALLERAGVRVVMTRTRTAGTSIGNIARARDRQPRRRGAVPPHPRRRRRLAVGARHAHALSRRAGAGWTDDIYAPSRVGGADVQSELVRALGFPDRGLQERSDLTGFNWADVPAILVEVGFMTNPTEDAALATSAVSRAGRRAGCAAGVLRFLGRSPARC